MTRILIAVAACAAVSAFAESNTLRGQPGFFKPTPDGNSSISRVVPPPASDAPKVEPPLHPVPDAAPPVDPDTGQPLVPNATVPVIANPVQRVREAEPEMDRAASEHRVMSQRSVTTTPIAPGAYNGATNERDR